MIDLDDLLTDPDFVTALTVYRRVQAIDNSGVVSTTPTLVAPNPCGSVQSGANADLLRKSDFAATDKLITIYTKFRLQPAGATTGVDLEPDATATTDAYGNQIVPTGAETTMADIVFWHGEPYEVFAVQDWTAYGDGWIEAACRKISSAEAGLP